MLNNQQTKQQTTKKSKNYVKLQFNQSCMDYPGSSLCDRPDLQNVRQCRR